MGVERLTKREAVGLFGGEKWEKALNRLIQLSKGAPIRLISGAQLLVRGAARLAITTCAGVVKSYRIILTQVGVGFIPCPLFYLDSNFLSIFLKLR